MNQHYNQNYSKEHICYVLEIIKDCVRENRYLISKNENRQENIDFITHYNLTTKKISKILLDIAHRDFCYSLQNTRTGFEHEILYVFSPQVMLYNISNDEELVSIYLKFNIIDQLLKPRVIVISFHKLNKPIDYLFR